MSEWWTYRPSDFVMFSPRTYWRLIELHNSAWWPLHALALGLGLLVVAAALRQRARAQLAAGLVLAAAWLFVAWAFHLQRYAAINTAAPAFALAFAAQALGLVLLALCAAGGRGAPSPRSGLLLMLLAVVAYPALGLLAGRSLLQAEVIGLSPDPTALFTLGWLLQQHTVADSRPWTRWLRRLCWPVPLLWCLGSGLTLWNLQAPDAALLPLAAAGALLAAWSGRRR